MAATLLSHIRTDESRFQSLMRGTRKLGCYWHAGTADTANALPRVSCVRATVACEPPRLAAAESPRLSACAYS